MAGYGLIVVRLCAAIGPDEDGFRFHFVLEFLRGPAA
jgi:hypothetical protein